MPIPPADIIAVLAPFAPLFSSRVWRHVPLLVVGALLAPGPRRVSAVLRVLGLGQLASFQTYHRVLSRARWSSLAARRVLLGLLVAAFAPDGPLLVGIDEPIERRRGAKITAAGLSRDPVRSSRGHCVTGRGRRWVSMMLLVPIPWAGRVWALPFLTVLAPSERSDAARGRRHKPVPAWARQMIRLVHRWYPDRELVVGDSEYAALDLLAGVRGAATVATRLRLDARLFAPAPPRRPGQRGRPRRVGARLPSLAARVADPATAWTPVTVASWYGEGERPVEVASDTAVWYHPGQRPVPIRWVLIRDPQGRFPTQALLGTDLTATPEQVLAWFVRRWQLEVTFHEVRAHLGVETQRQWAPLAIRRTPPALLGLFSLVTLLAHDHLAIAPRAARQTAWYAKPALTFVDALALVRRRLWTRTVFRISADDQDRVEVPRAFLDHLYDLLCYAA